MKPSTYPGLGDRALAFLIDMFVVFAAVLAGALAVTESGAIPGGPRTLCLALAAYYVILPLTPLQATLGRAATRWKIADAATGGRIRAWQSLVRFLVSVPSIALMGIGVLVSGWTARRQTLHDLAARTVVVRRSATPEDLAQPAPPLSWFTRIGHIALMAALTFLVWMNVEIHNSRNLRNDVYVALAHGAAYRGEVQKALRAGQPIPLPPTSLPRQVRALSAQPDGTIFIDVADAIAEGGRLVYRPQGSALAEVQWACSAERIPARALPGACR